MIKFTWEETDRPTLAASIPDVVEKVMAQFIADQATTDAEGVVTQKYPGGIFELFMRHVQDSLIGPIMQMPQYAVLVPESAQIAALEQQQAALVAQMKASMAVVVSQG